MLTYSLCGKFLAGFEPDGLARRYRHLGPGSRVAADATLSRLDHKNAKSAQFDPFALSESLLHRLKERFHDLFGLMFRHPGFIGNQVDYI